MTTQGEHGVYLGARLEVQTPDYIADRLADEDRTTPLLTPNLSALMDAYTKELDGALGTGEEVAEIGIGTGASILPLLEARPDVKVVGIDINEQRLERCRYRLAGHMGRVSLVHADAAEYLQERTAADDKLTVISSANTLHNLHLANRIPILRAAFGALDNGGRFVDFDKHENDDPVIAERDYSTRVEHILSMFNDDSSRADAWVNHFSDDHDKDQPRGEYLELLREIGFDEAGVVLESGLEVVISARKGDEL